MRETFPAPWAGSPCSTAARLAFRCAFLRFFRSFLDSFLLLPALCLAPPRDRRLVCFGTAFTSATCPTDAIASHACCGMEDKTLLPAVAMAGLCLRLGETDAVAESTFGLRLRSGRDVSGPASSGLSRTAAASAMHVLYTQAIRVRRTVIVSACKPKARIARSRTMLGDILHQICKMLNLGGAPWSSLLALCLLVYSRWQLCFRALLGLLVLTCILRLPFYPMGRRRRFVVRLNRWVTQWTKVVTDAGIVSPVDAPWHHN